MTDESLGIKVQWLPWAESAAAILELRRQVFVEEQGIAGDIVSSPHDAAAIHLGALVDGVLVACISAYLFAGDDHNADLAAYQLPPQPGLTVQFTRRLELASHRGHGITEVLSAGLFRHVYESLRPTRIFLILRDRHRSLRSHYHRLFDFQHHADVGEGAATMTIMTVAGEAPLRSLYLKTRAMAESAHRRCPVTVPSLVCYLASVGRDKLLPRAQLAAENLYVEPLSLADEVPRLSAQNRLLFAEQTPRLAATAFPRAPARLLDVGTGTGVYLSLLATAPALHGYDIAGHEPSPEMLAYAQFAFPKLRLLQGSAYATGEPDASVDVVTANFVMIHLRNPDLALLELRRVLRPGGLLYLCDVNDASFAGPAPIKAMVEAHHRHHEGDRTVMASMPRRAAEFGFEPVHHFRTVVRNTGGVEPMFAPDEVRLGRMSMWGMLSFMGQRGAIDEVFQAAEELYLGSDCEISLNIETQVYRRPLEPDGQG